MHVLPTFIVSALVLLMSHATPATAAVSVYAELLEDIQGDSVILISYATAEDDQCEGGHLTIDAKLFGPGGAWLGQTSSQGWCGASASHYYTQGYDSFVNGNYEARGFASGAGGQSGCASLIKLFSKFEARFYYVGQGGEGHEYFADACVHKCQQPFVIRPSYQGPYLWNRGLNIEVFGFGVCRHNYQGSFQRGLCTPP